MKHFVITIDGVARIMHAVDSVVDPMDEVAKWPPARQALVTAARPIDPANIPNHRSLRGAWRDTGTEIVWDIPAAKEIKVDLVRVERDRRLKETDKEIIMLDGGPVPPGLVQKRQALRDLPVTVSAQLAPLTDPADIDAFEPNWPS